MSSPAELLDAVREEAKPGLWSLGVNLARAGAVVRESEDANEIVLRVKVSARPVPWTVVLYPKDLAWECNCPSKFDPCEHSVAAAIALKEALAQGSTVAAAEARFRRVTYRFVRVDAGLQLHRTIARPDGTEVELPGTLSALLQDPAEARALQVEQFDLLADRLLERRTARALPPERLEALLTVLGPATTVLFEGRPVAVSQEVVLPRAVVEDDGGGFKVSVTRDPRLVDVVSAGVGLTEDTLCRLGETGFTGAWLERLPWTRTFSGAQLGELTGKVLPDLERRFPVEVQSPRIPRVDRELKPRMLLEVNHVEGGLSVLPTLVYGAPPHVRIDNGRMVHLKGAVPQRDEAVEQRLLHRLRDELNLVPGRRTNVTGPDAARLANSLSKWSGGLTGDGARTLKKTRLVPSMRLDSTPGAQVPSVGFALDFTLEGAEAGGPRSVDAAAVLRAWKDGLDVVPIEGGGWAPLPREFLEKHGERVAALLAARQADGKLANHALLQLDAMCEALEAPKPPGLEKLKPLVEGFDTLPEPELPTDLTATLRPYQRQGVAWLQFLARAGLGGLLADDMGLGKTLQAACVLGPPVHAERSRSVPASASPHRSLVVCPTSVLPNWLRELARFRPSLKVHAFHGPSRRLDDSADVTVTSWALLRLDAALLGAKRWDTLVLDEAQAMKNPDSQVARAAYGLEAGFRLALTGTPVENRLEELWSVMHFANPGLLGGRRDFEETLARPIAEGQAGASSELRRRIRPFVLRRLKKDVAPDLPPRSEAVRYVTLSEAERAVYDAVFAATRAEVVQVLESGGGVMKALEALLRLRQAACHSALVPGQTAKRSSKLEVLLESLATVAAEGHKALVFSQWTSLLDLIEPSLKSADLGFVRLDGSTPDRGAVTERFQAKDGPPVMLLSLKAGGTGLTLTAADHVFLVDPWWNPAVEAQAADRAHRIGQDKPVMVYRLVSQGTVEERILTLQEKKRALFEAALGEGGVQTALTKDDLLGLFEAVGPG